VSEFSLICADVSLSLESVEIGLSWVTGHCVCGLP